MAWGVQGGRIGRPPYGQPPLKWQRAGQQLAIVKGVHGHPLPFTQVNEGATTNDGATIEPPVVEVGVDVDENEVDEIEGEFHDQGDAKCQ
jgi:hypothetical protein